MADLTNWNPMNWDPYEEFQRMREGFAQFLRGSNVLPSRADGNFPATAWGPSVDVKETDDAMIVRAEIPGVDPADLDLTITEDGMSIRGETKQEIDENEKGYHRIERRYGSFRRTIPFPVAVRHDEATADYHNGILHVKVPKAEMNAAKATKLRVTGRPPGTDRSH